jgi:threonine/homoserine/homoserine lactone efflux protein
MFEAKQLVFFTVATLLLNITPGQDTMYIIGRTLTQGKKAGIISVFGISIGVLCHTVFAALGLALLMKTQPALYTCVKTAGALYLMYLGLKIFSSARHIKSHPQELSETSSRRLFIDGFLTNLFNPKVALFFLTFLPQFIPADAEGPVPFLLLGLLFSLCSLPWCLTLVHLAASATQFFQQKPQARQTMHRVSGLAFIGMGTVLVLQR